MTLDKHNWKNLPSKETPITAEMLNELEKVKDFRETTINGKTGEITKMDILALGIPIEKGDYDDWNNIFIGGNQPEIVEDIVL